MTATAPATAEPAIVLPDGFSVTVELAANDETRAQGLMYRESLASGRGMLFVFSSPSVQSFWMKNTLIPLDMIWMDGSGTIVAIHRSVPPCKADPCPTYDPKAEANYVLELAGGEAAKHGLTVGSRLQLPDLTGLIVR
jgi:hypothetical protein